MKKGILVTLSIIAVCSLCLAGTVNAYKAGYQLESCFGTAPTYDGRSALLTNGTMLSMIGCTLAGQKRLIHLDLKYSPPTLSTKAGL